MAGGFLGHRGLMETYVLTTARESCSPADSILGSCWDKAALYKHPGSGDKGGKRMGGTGFYNMEQMNLRITEDLQNLASNI